MAAALWTAAPRRLLQRRRWASGGPAAKHVVVGMSGGVDSSVAALLLRRQGFRVTGVFMKNWDASDEQGGTACPVDADYQDAKRVCDQLGVEARQVNLVQSYWNAVFAPSLESFEEVRASIASAAAWR